MQPTIWGINVSWIYTWVLDISGRHLGAACIVGVSVRPLGAVLGNINLLKYIFVLNICCQQFGEYMSVEYICWYWIYHANSWGDECKSGAWLGNIYISKYTFVLDICCKQFWEYIVGFYQGGFFGLGVVIFFFKLWGLIWSTISNVCADLIGSPGLSRLRDLVKLSFGPVSSGRYLKSNKKIIVFG